jgi:hypothetical protein
MAAIENFLFFGASVPEDIDVTDVAGSEAAADTLDEELCAFAATPVTSIKQKDTSRYI